jgi:hypothetical protein
MKPTPFDAVNDFAPIPFDHRVYEAAEQLKTAGLSWRPHVGCFVRDLEVVIPEPSPFPDRVYFILNLNHFIQRFGSIEAVAQRTVWIPTLHQCWELLSKRGRPGHHCDLAVGEPDLYLETYDHLLSFLEQDLS